MLGDFVDDQGLVKDLFLAVVLADLDCADGLTIENKDEVGQIAIVGMDDSDVVWRDKSEIRMPNDETRCWKPDRGADINNIPMIWARIPMMSIIEADIAARYLCCIWLSAALEDLIKRTVRNGCREGKGIGIHLFRKGAEPHKREFMVTKKITTLTHVAWNRSKSNSVLYVGCHFMTKLRCPQRISI